MPRTPIFKHNPSRCPPEELRATFVARRAILEDLLEELRARAVAPVNQHFLITGPRGIGKTNLLLMIRDGILRDEELSGAYQPLQTAEEEYSIASLAHLFARVLDLLMAEAPDEDLARARARMDEHEDEDAAAESGIRAVEDWCSRSRRRIVLLIDNLDLILGGQLDDDAQIGRLRDLLVNGSFLVLIGAAPTHFREVSGYDRPFYNFLRPVELEELTADQVADLLRRRAELDGNREILARFEELQDRTRVIHRLAGGNPRLVLMLYDLCAGGDLPGIRTAVETLLDEVTPHYKHRLEQLPPQPRRVMDTFARLGRPATPSELAVETRLRVNQIGSILKRLRDLGFVTVARQRRRRRTYYQVSERVFRIWHQMRFSTSGRRLGFLIEFLKAWYTPGEEKVEEAARVAASGADRSLYSAQGLRIRLARCAVAVEAGDAGRAAGLFARALERAGEGPPVGELVGFFRRVTRAERAGLAGELLELVAERGGEDLRGILEPFSSAVEYWLAGRDEEVLERLNPEVREIVEEIVRAGEDGAPGSGPSG